jgi:hypothetical protein
MPKNDKVDTLIREDVQHVREKNPALVEQLRRYEKDWQRFKPLVTSKGAKDATRASKHTYRSA